MHVNDYVASLPRETELGRKKGDSHTKIRRHEKAQQHNQARLIHIFFPNSLQLLQYYSTQFRGAKEC